MKHNYLENRTLEEALAGYLAFLKPLLKPLKTEVIKVAEACGRTTASACTARLSSPHYNACAMDGIAVRAADTFGASELSPVALEQSQYQMVDTGDPLPEGFDAVIMIEDVIFDSNRAVVRTAACAWQHVRQIGEDLCEGDMILPSYTRLTPAAIGALLAGGITEIETLSRVRVGIIPTGDELIPPGQTPEDGEIIEFNSAMLKAYLADCAVRVYPIVRDEPLLLKKAVDGAVLENDLVLINAGSSAGRDDYTKAVIQTVFCHGIAIRPGKPTVLGANGSVPVIGLPGYPVSAAVALEQLVLPVIAMMTKTAAVPPHTVRATMARRVVSSLKYQEFLRVKLGYIGERLVACPVARGAGAVA
ncbi:MAG: molybdopterin-binding protein, partial [Clostridia bacterium]|nr:molybdopterin-binding protein [Clostridia bacterium]